MRFLPSTIARKRGEMRITYSFARGCDMSSIDSHRILGNLAAAEPLSRSAAVIEDGNSLIRSHFTKTDLNRAPISIRAHAGTTIVPTV